MCNFCREKAERLSSLAQYFREKARETTMADYIELMVKTSETLDEMRKTLVEQCRYRSDASQGEPSCRVHSERQRPFEGRSAPAWTNYRDCANWR